VLNQGDVIPVEQVTKGEANAEPPENTYALRQIPDVSGALVALDPHTGRVLAMSGGYDPEISGFNRATQAKRQPGSAFKPFVYLAGLDHGFTPATKILDAPFVYEGRACRNGSRPTIRTSSMAPPRCGSGSKSHVTS
jgi:penicillin-binding protein 1A